MSGHDPCVRLAPPGCFLAGHPGVVRLTVVEEDVPHLLSIGLLEHTKAVIDTEKNDIHFKALDGHAQMSRLESGHRLLNVTEGARKFSVPPQVLTEYNLSPEDFHCSDSEIARAYIAASESAADALVISWDNFEVNVRSGIHQNMSELEGFSWVSRGIVTSEACHLLCRDQSLCRDKLENNHDNTDIISDNSHDMSHVVQHSDCDPWTIDIFTHVPLSDLSFNESCQIFNKVGGPAVSEHFQKEQPSP